MSRLLSLERRNAYLRFTPLSLVSVYKIKCLRCNNSFNLKVLVSRKSCTKILFHVIV